MDEGIIKDIRKTFRLKKKTKKNKENEAIKDRISRDARNLFKQEKNIIKQ